MESTDLSQIDKEIIDKLEDWGFSIYKQLQHLENPKISLSLRTKSNVFYDEQTSIIRMGSKIKYRSFFNVAHTRKFMQTVLIASALREYILSNRTVSQREIYYNLKHRLAPGVKANTFENEEREVVPVLQDLETSLGVIRDSLHIIAKSRGRIYGDIVLKQAGDEFSCKNLGRGGWSIPGYVEDVEIVDYNADFILFVENDAMLHRLIEEKAWKKLNALLITGEGQPPRGVKRFLRILKDKTNLPVIVFNDGDPWGFYIYFVVKHGSINLAAFSDKYAVPDAKYIGMTMDDVDKYGLENVTEPLKDADYKRLKELLENPWIKKEHWQRQLAIMLKRKIRLEQQALANKSLSFVVDEYLPEKLEKQEFLD